MEVTNQGSTYIKIPSRVLYFSGGSDYISLSQEGSLTGEFTISLWVKRSSTSDYHMIIGNTITNQKIGFENGSLKVFIRIENGGSSYTYGSVSLNEWHHIVVTRNSDNKIDLYIDDVGGTRLFSDIAQAGTYYYNRIGDDGTPNQFHGYMSDICIWNVALTSSQICQLYNRVTVAKSSIVNYWKFDDRRGSTLTDSIGGNDGTIYFAVWSDREISCWNTRWDGGNWDVTVETFMESQDRNYLFSSVTPNAVRESYNILGTPSYLDTTYLSANTLIIEPRYGYGISSLRQSRKIGVKNISDTFLENNKYAIKIEGLRLDTD